MSAVSQREFTFPCLSKLLFKVSVVISTKLRVRFCAFWNHAGSWIKDNVLLHHFTLEESISGLININEGRENDTLVFWPE